MDVKKPLIGVCICAVVLLVLGSLTNVVGYQSVKSTTVNDSPLFQTRTQRATNQQQNIITSQYLGNGKVTLLQFLIRDNKAESLIMAIKFICNIDDNTFTQFTKLCVQKVRQDSSLRNINHNEIVQALYLLKTKPETIINSFINRNNQNITSSEYYTIYNLFPGCTINNWFPGCIPLFILHILVEVISELYDIVIVLLMNRFATCGNDICTIKSRFK